VERICYWEKMWRMFGYVMKEKEAQAMIFAAGELQTRDSIFLPEIADLKSGVKFGSLSRQQVSQCTCIDPKTFGVHDPLLTCHLMAVITCRVLSLVQSAPYTSMSGSGANSKQLHQSRVQPSLDPMTAHPCLPTT
jgi:hypothetical protein